MLLQDIPGNPDGLTNGRTLSNVQTHYILKSIVAFELHREWSGLAHLGGLTKYGIPYGPEAVAILSPNTKGGAPPTFNPTAIPEPLILRLLFRQHVLTFPGIDVAPKKYWTRRIQPWFDGIASHGLSTSIERGVPTKRHQLSLLLTRLVGSYFSRGVGIVFADSVSTLGQESAARPGDEEMRAINDVFPGVSNALNSQGWYVGVVDSLNRKNMFVVASQKKGDKVIFVVQSQEAFESLAKQVRVYSFPFSLFLF